MASDKIISLIGMPGSGKSTIGAALAARLDLELVDADGLIEAQEGQSLQQIMDGRGNAAFRAVEEQVLTGMPLFPSVISTGGSVVYSEKIMARLSAASTILGLATRLSTSSLPAAATSSLRRPSCVSPALGSLGNRVARAPITTSGSAACGDDCDDDAAP